MGLEYKFELPEERKIDNSIVSSRRGSSPGESLARINDDMESSRMRSTGYRAQAESDMLRKLLLPLALGLGLAASSAYEIASTKFGDTEYRQPAAYSQSIDFGRSH